MRPEVFDRGMDDAAMAEVIAAYMVGKRYQQMSHLSKRFGITTDAARPIVLKLVEDGRLKIAKDGNQTVYGVGKFIPPGGSGQEPPANAVKAAAPPLFKPMQANRQMLDRLESIRAERVLYPSKHN